MEVLKQLDELYEHGLLDDEEYDRRRKDVLDSLSFGSTAGPERVTGDGIDTCDKCGDAFDEIEPPFCANCGAKTRYFGKVSLAMSDEDSDSLEPPPPPVDDVDEFGQDMLDDLLDELRVTDTRSTAGSSSSRDTFAYSGKEQFSPREQAQPSAKKAMPRDTFAMRGDERFSEREAERTREEKARAKAKAKKVGARPGVGGQDESWEALQMQMKQKQKQRQGGGAPAAKKKEVSMPRGTFAGADGKERFSARDASKKQQSTRGGMMDETWESLQQQSAQKKKEADWERLQAQMSSKKKAGGATRKKVTAAAVADDLDAELAALEAEFEEDEEVEVKPKTKSKPQSRETFVGVSGSERFSGRSTTASGKKKAAPAASRETFVGVSGAERFSGRSTTAGATKKKASVAPSASRETFVGVSGAERFSKRAPKGSVASRETFAGVRGTERFSGREEREQTADEIDAELAALEADLGESMLAAPKGRRVQAAQPAPSAAAPARKKEVVRSKVQVERAQGGPELPEGLQWQQTPVRSEMPRGTFAHHGQERFSDRRDPNLPKGVQQESPSQACNFCHKSIEKGQKFKTALGVLWHRECFKCGVCQIKLEKGMKFFKGDMGSAICADCKQKRRKVCYLCKQPTAKQEVVNVMGAKVHTRCFRCNICDTSLLGGYLQVKGQFVCIAHKDCDPVPRNWADPNDRGPGQAPARPVVRMGPSEADKKRNAAKKKRAEQEKLYRATRQEERDALVDLDLLNDLLEETGGAPQAAAMADDDEYFRDMRESDYNSVRESDILRYAEPTPTAAPVVRRSSAVRKPRRSSRRVSELTEAESPPRLSSEQMMANADKPDWMRERDEQERGSFRSKARAAQEELNRKQGFHEDAGYYSMSDDDDDDDFDDMGDGDFRMKMTYSQQNSSRRY